MFREEGFEQKINHRPYERSRRFPLLLRAENLRETGLIARQVDIDQGFGQEPLKLLATTFTPKTTTTFTILTVNQGIISAPTMEDEQEAEQRPWEPNANLQAERESSHHALLLDHL